MTRIPHSIITTFLSLIFPTATLTLSAQTDSIADQHLDEITVTAKAPEVRVTADRTIYNLTSSAGADNGTLMDALSSIPGIDVSNEGTISLYGNQGATLVIDGQRTYLKGRELANYLRSLPASMVSTISLRTTVSAKDDATDKNGIIEIATRRERRKGFSLSANSNISAWRNLQGGASLNSALNTGKSEFTLLYSYWAYRRRTLMEIDRPYINQTDRMLQHSLRRRIDNTHTLKGSYRYNFSPDTHAGVSLNLARNMQNESGLMDSRIPAINETSNSTNHNYPRWKNLMADLYFNHNFKDGSELSVGLNHFRILSKERQLSESSNADTLRSTVRGSIKWFIDRVDLTKKFEGGWKLQVGIKNTFVYIHNSGTYDRRIDGDWSFEPDLSSTFRYRANTNAAYLQAEFNSGPISATAGARLEHESIHGSFSGNETAPDTTYRISTIDIVPSVTIKYVTESRLAIMLSYSRRLQRPNYADLNPFIYIFDEFTHSGGNIKLHTATTDNLQFGIAFNGRFQGALFFSRSNDAIIKGFHEISDRTVYVAAENIPLYIQTGARLTLANQPIGKRWTLTASASLLYNRYDWPDVKSISSTRRFTPMLNLSNQFSLGKGWDAELKANYIGEMAFGQVMLRPSGNVNVSLRKSLLDGKASISMFLKDIFATDKSKAVIMFDGRTATQTEDELKRCAGISFTYKFHTGRKTDRKTASEEPEELKRL